MTTIRDDIVSRAEHVFDTGGFAASGVDRLTAAAGVSTRTLYKHVGSKADLVVAVLRARADRFFRAVADAVSLDDLFVRLASWTEAEGARGCLFLRAQGENGAGGHDAAAVAEVVATYRARLRERIAELVAAQEPPEQTGARSVEKAHDEALLTEQILVLFEGATSAASYRGTVAVEAARDAAAALLRSAR